MTADGFDELVQTESKSEDDVEDRSGEECEILVETKRHHGYPDLTAKCTVTHPGDWWTEERQRGKPDDTIKRTRYRWDGTTYKGK